MSRQIPFSVTFTPRGGSLATLVPVGGWLAGGPDFAAEQQVFEVPGVALGNEFFRALGGATVGFELAIETDETTLLAAQVKMLDAGLPLHGALAFVADGWEAVFDPAVIADREPMLPGGTGAATLVRTLTVRAGIPTLTED